MITARQVKSLCNFWVNPVWHEQEREACLFAFVLPNSSVQSVRGT